MLSRPEYVGADYDVIANSMTGFFEFEKGDVRPAPDQCVLPLQRDLPIYSDAIWYLTQMRRWGQISTKQSRISGTTLLPMFIAQTSILRQLSMVGSSKRS